MLQAPRDRWLTLNYAAAIFTSAFLLFQVQPLVSKHILPWFGGGPAVWTTCLLFFQTLLFFGYAYAHFIHGQLRPRQQVIVHMGLVIAAIVFARVLPGASWEPRGGEDPVPTILLILLVSVGLPYFVLSGTGPLLQAWFARSFPGRSPYRLYALSNVGSLLALLSYPFFFERHFSVPRQAQIWSAGFLLYAALCAFAAWRLWTRSRVRRGGRESESRRDSPTTDPPRFPQRILWLLLPMFASIVLMATTNHVSTDIAVMPFLWIAPLALYLVTFIIAFDRPAWYRRTPLAVLILAAIYVTALIHHLGVGRSKVFDAGTPGLVFSALSLIVSPVAISPEFRISTLTFLIINFAAMFAICMLCHGELFRQRPDPRYLTSYYLMIALGGALGGFFVTFVAPQVFSTYYEWELSLFIATVFAIGFLLRALVDVAFREDDNRTRRPAHYALLAMLVLGVFLPSAVMLLDMVEFLQPPTAAAQLRVRNFFGTLAVLERNEDDPDRHLYLVKHGTITHGAQFSNQRRRREPTTYYGRDTGVARAIDYYRRQLENEQMRLAVVGLGTGTLAAYVDGGDAITFYEINPAVLKIADGGRWFSYLHDCRQRGAHCDIRLGDARLTLRRELQIGSPPLGGEGLGEGGLPLGQHYHLLILDAFSGDSVPAHLLTVEAFELYLAHLSRAGDSQSPGGEDGAILVHISNRYLDLAPLAYGIADRFGLRAIRIDSNEDEKQALYGSVWVILTRNQKLADELSHFQVERDSTPTVLWTDTHSSLFDVLK
ncbi:MAG: hypothetical protein L0228_06140 [Planctomycetes bacterium]|nr:hypothetical protein [Planctomycetota bacterium]